MNTSTPLEATPAAATPAPASTAKKPAAKPKARAAAKPAGKSVAKPVTKAPAKPAAKAAPKAPVKKSGAPKPARAPAKDLRKEKPAAVPASRKIKMIRDSFTMPKDEYAAIGSLKDRGAKLGRPLRKSEILRAGIQTLKGLNDKALLAAIAALPPVKAGRPKSKNVG